MFSIGDLGWRTKVMRKLFVIWYSYLSMIIMSRVCAVWGGTSLRGSLTCTTVFKSLQLQYSEKCWTFGKL